MERTLRLVGKTSNEIFMLRYPRSVLKFCEYDLTYFAENAIALCNEALKTGEPDFDRMTELRNTLMDAHVYIEHHIRTIYDKIVIDCWIDYVCRRDNVGTGSLWNRFIGCSNAFEKLVFSRLCDFRYNRAINEWLNLVRVQDYAKNKISFLFSKNLRGAEEAAARRNYFDLIFSVTAKELGCRLEDMGVTKVFSVGRVPSAPFIFPGISKDIVKNVLADFDYGEDYSNSERYGDLSDQIAMDAFSHMKAGLPQEFESYNISRNQMENSPTKVYMPCGLKATIDLEIDALIESGGWLARCKRCGRYYLRDREHTEEYCSLLNLGGKTCLEIYEEEHPRTKIPEELEQQCAELTDIMYDRVDKTMSLSEYESWKSYLEAMKKKVENDEITVEELGSFLNYSRSMDLSKSNPVVEVQKKEPEPPPTRERVVKPFVPERISRSELAAAKPKQPDEDELLAKREGFFTSPIVQRQKNEHAPISHIIRGGEQRGVSETRPPANTFMPFGERRQPAAPVQTVPTEPPKAENNVAAYDLKQFDAPQNAPEKRSYESDFSAYDNANRRTDSAQNAPEKRGYESDFSAYDNTNRRTDSVQNAPEKRSYESDFSAYDNANRRTDSVQNAPEKRSYESNFSIYDEKPQKSASDRRSHDDDAAAFDVTKFENETAKRESGKSTFESGFDAFETSRFEAATSQFSPEKQDNVTNSPEPTVEQKPRTHIVRKNAAAISAYGKIAGTPLSAAEPRGMDVVSAPEKNSERDSAPETDPFKDVGNIFDILEQSELSMDDLDSSFDSLSEMKDEPVEEAAPPEPVHKKHSHKKRHAEPVPEWESEPEAPETAVSEPTATEKVTAENAPSGFWTEDRHLYPEDSDESQSELNMLKEKKKGGRSSKTRHLYEAIMREPDDNPNFRRR